MKTYDAVISLGGICACASQMRRRGLRRQSLGLDWVGAADDVAIRYLCRGLFDGFSEMDVEGAFEWCSPPGVLSNLVGYFNKRTHQFLLHTFHISEKKAGWFELDARKLRERLDRLFAVANGANSILFVFGTRFEHDISLDADLLFALKKAFPHARVDLTVVQFAAKTGPFGCDVGSDGVSVMRYERMDNFEYDNHRTSSEWAFLDEVRLTSMQGREKHGAVKVVYKIWKKLTRYLYAHGVIPDPDFLYVKELNDLPGLGVGDKNK